MVVSLHLSEGEGDVYEGGGEDLVGDPGQAGGALLHLGGRLGYRLILLSTYTHYLYREAEATYEEALGPCTDSYPEIDSLNC